jgi:hypothetical protein
MVDGVREQLTGDVDIVGAQVSRDPALDILRQRRHGVYYPRS